MTKKTKKVKGKRNHQSRFKYNSLKEVDNPPATESEYDSDAYDYFKSVKWDKAWHDFLELRDDGNYKYPTSWSLCNKIAGNSRNNADKVSRARAQWLYLAIGPKAKSKKKMVPYLGDWSYMRQCMFTGEQSKESLLFGNPKVSAIRDLVKKHIDVMEVSKGIGELMMTWLGRYDAMATQVDEQFGYKLFDPKLSDEKNEKRFHRYTKMQEYLFSRHIDATRQILRCFGVGENDISLLAQMMIASMRGRLGDGTANMMMAAASGIKTIDGIAGALPPAQQNDDTVIAGSVNALANNPQLKMMFGTFLGKSQVYKMEHPDITIDGVPPDDKRTDPKLDPPKGKLNGKTNGKAAKLQ